MLVWLTLSFYDFCGFQSVAVNSVYKMQFFTFIFAVLLPVLSRLLIMSIKGVFDYRIWIRIHTESSFRFREKVHLNNKSESGFRFGETCLQLQIH